MNDKEFNLGGGVLAAGVDDPTGKKQLEVYVLFWERGGGGLSPHLLADQILVSRFFCQASVVTAMMRGPETALL